MIQAPDASDERPSEQPEAVLMLMDQAQAGVEAVTRRSSVRSESEQGSPSDTADQSHGSPQNSQSNQETSSTTRTPLPGSRPMTPAVPVASGAASPYPSASPAPSQDPYPAPSPVPAANTPSQGHPATQGDLTSQGIPTSQGYPTPQGHTATTQGYSATEGYTTPQPAPTSQAYQTYVSPYPSTGSQPSGPLSVVPSITSSLPPEPSNPPIPTWWPRSTQATASSSPSHNPPGRPHGVKTKQLTQEERFRIRVLYFDAKFSYKRIQEITGATEAQVRTAVRAESATPKPRTGRPPKHRGDEGGAGAGVTKANDTGSGKKTARKKQEATIEFHTRGNSVHFPDITDEQE